ncbi:hypothetical protein J6590_015273 [Homalodisca vitripennis]|nr:hypothetical protein J6590_015273 [Homalodisca vitripennis]
MEESCPKYARERDPLSRMTAVKHAALLSSRRKLFAPHSSDRLTTNTGYLLQPLSLSEQSGCLNCHFVKCFSLSRGGWPNGRLDFGDESVERPTDCTKRNKMDCQNGMFKDNLYLLGTHIDCSKRNKMIYQNGMFKDLHYLPGSHIDCTKRNKMNCQNGMFNNHLYHLDSKINFTKRYRISCQS